LSHQELGWRRHEVPPLSRSVECEPECAICGAPTARLELLAPGEWQTQWDWWSSAIGDTPTEHQPDRSWWLIFQGVDAGNGHGNPMTADEGERLAAIFSAPITFETVRAAGFYDDLGFCEDCGVPYCATHWSVSRGGYGHCPQGHGKSLDPHWSPSDYD
jgi:hypothetical protein